jgi:uncharacterized protein
MLPSQRLIDELGLLPHPEGGWYREIFRSGQRVTARMGSRSAMPTIYYLLERHQVGRWHVVEADEVWHFYAGSPLELFAYEPAGQHLERLVLATPGDGEPVRIVPSGVWQSARSLGDYSLVGCTVAPGFEFDDFSFVTNVPGHEEHFAHALRHLSDLL